jgi:hypothetical protein
MKKKLIVLASVAMLSVGAAFYANKSSYINALSENDVEALTDTGEGSGGNSGNTTYYEFGTNPHRVWVDNITHMVTIEGYTKAKDDDGEYINDCELNSNRTCQLSTASTLYNVEHYASILTETLKSLSDCANIVNWVKGLFKKK